MYLAILLNRYAEVRSEVSSAPPLLKVTDVLQSWLVDIISIGSKSLANRIRSNFNNRKMRNKFQDVRYLLLRLVVVVVVVGTIATDFRLQPVSDQRPVSNAITYLNCEHIVYHHRVHTHLTAVRVTLSVIFSTYDTL